MFGLAFKRGSAGARPRYLALVTARPPPRSGRADARACAPGPGRSRLRKAWASAPLPGPLPSPLPFDIPIYLDLLRIYSLRVVDLAARAFTPEGTRATFDLGVQ